MKAQGVEDRRADHLDYVVIMGALRFPYLVCSWG